MDKQQKNPYDTAGLFSRIFFWWFNQFAFIGLKRRFQETDLCKHPKDEDSDRLGNLLKKEWDEELEKRNPSLLKSIFRVYGYKFVFLYLLNLFQECFLLIIQAYLIGIMIDYFEYKFVEKQHFAYISAAGLCCCMLLYILTFLSFMYISYRINMRIGISLSNIIYKKGLRLSQASLGKSHIGQMVNILSNDISKTHMCVNRVVIVISAPLQIIVTTLMLWQYLGPAALAGISVVLLYIPLQIGLGRILSSFRFKTAELADKRLHLLNELLSGMRVIKMYSWEILFAESVEKIRRKELKSIKKSLFIHGIPYTMGIIMIKFMLFFSYFTYFMIESKLSATTAFVTSSLLVNMYKSIFVSFSQAVGTTVEILVSMERIQKFLLLEEKHNANVQESRPCIKDCGVWVENLTASWNKDSEPTLKNITLNAKPGDLLVIVGSVGSGKTSLLMALLGEIPIFSGNVTLNGKVSYSSQEPWIYNETIRKNILFYDDYYETKYNEILYITALEKDINDFPEGDLTLVGEKGRIMSGGQKSRINLARALYHDADVFILDDPLSAVDPPVAKHIFQNCIKNFLKEKVTILITHQIQFLEAATKIILLKEGKIEAVGDYNTLKKFGINFGILTNKLKTDSNNISDSQQLSIHDKNISKTTILPHSEQNVIRRIDTTHKKIEVKTNESENRDDERKINSTQRIIRYKSYINSGIGRIFQFALIFFFILTQALINGSDYWIVKWTKRDNNYVLKKNQFYNCTIKTDNYVNVTNCTETELLSYTYSQLNMFIYSGMIFGLIITFLVTIVSYFLMCSRCSLALHKRLLHRIIRTPIAFFDMNPVGKLLSRFSRDMGIVDQQLPVSTLFVISTSMNILGMIVLQIVVQPYLIIPSFILLITVGMLSYLFVGIASDLQHLDGITSSLIFSHLSTSLYGISTIRAFKAERNFESAFNEYQNKQTSCKFLYWSIIIWTASKIHISCFLNAVITIVTVYSLSSSITAGEVGLIMTYTSTITLIFAYIYFHIVQSEGQLVSVERILDYCKLSPEASLTSLPNMQPPDDWPQKGIIEFRNVSLKYEGDEQYVLKNLNFYIKPAEKIGIVGRTGAGKSSIIAALFRMVETTGIISIDGIVTKDIGLHDLRNKMSIIPQDPLLFSGSLRKNIDPFEKHVDETLWKILEKVQLKNTVQNLKGGLDAELLEGGNNFSVGQKQLICLARAILHRNKILILDEATAFIDKETDYLIQKTIREKFTSSTILTIAHRLQTIMDSDRVMVLQDGKIEEFDHPNVLLQNPNSIFSNMAKTTGKDISTNLQIINHETHLAIKEKDENLKGNEEHNELKFFNGGNIENKSGNNVMCIGEFSEQSEYFCEDTKM